MEEDVKRAFVEVDKSLDFLLELIHETCSLDDVSDLLVKLGNEHTQQVIREIQGKLEPHAEQMTRLFETMCMAIATLGDRVCALEAQVRSTPVRVTVP